MHRLEAVRSRYPYQPAGSFTSADERLNKVCDICRETVRLCSNESIMDTPWREQAQRLGDVSAVTAPAIRALFSDVGLIEKFIADTARTVVDQGTMSSISNAAAPAGSRPGRDIPDYALWWAIDLAAHYRYTGDRDFAERYFPALRRVIDGIAAHRTDQGTLNGFGWVFIDWAHLDTSGEPAALSVIFYGALEAASWLADQLGADQDRDRWTDLADRLRSHFRQRFWSDEAAAFVDAVHPDGTRSTMISEQTNFAAIRFGLVPDDQAGPLAERILADRSVTEAQPFFTSVVLDALHRIGRTDLALRVIDHRWGRRMVDRGATSCFEEWGINGSWRNGDYSGFMRTLSHAWSAHPATFLISSLPGVRILEPGCSRIGVDPYLGLDYQAVFPTPLGAVRVEVDQGTAHVTVPPGVELVPQRSLVQQEVG